MRRRHRPGPLPMVVYGTTDPKAGACDTLYHITNDPRLNHRAHVVGGVLADRCAALLSEFFATRRKLRKNGSCGSQGS